MTGLDVERDMRRANLTDQKIESLLGGAAPEPGDHLAGDLASMRQSLSEAFPLPVIPEHVEDSHLARMMAAAVPAPAFAAEDVRADRTAPLNSLKASFSRRVAALTLAFSTAFGGAAYAGVLPGPVQGAVAKAASVVGLHLPGDEEEALVEDDERGDGHNTDGDGNGQELAPAGDDLGDEGRDGSGGAGLDGAEDRRDDEQDAKENAEDDSRDGAEDRQDDEADGRDDGSDGREAEDHGEAAEDRRDEIKDQSEQEAEQTEEEADDERDAAEEAEDGAEESRQEVEDLEEDSPTGRGSVAGEAEEPEPGDD